MHLNKRNSNKVIITVSFCPILIKSSSPHDNRTVQNLLYQVLNKINLVLDLKMEHKQDK